MAYEIKKGVLMNDLVSGRIKEWEDRTYQQGYDQAMRDALTTIKSLLKHNDIRMHSKEFWTEYKTLKLEGVIK